MAYDVLPAEMFWQDRLLSRSSFHSAILEARVSQVKTMSLQDWTSLGSQSWADSQTSCDQVQLFFYAKYLQRIWTKPYLF